jgi:outer membrane protein OmpA-like peptidoglycan-associated protein
MNRRNFLKSAAAASAAAMIPALAGEASAQSMPSAETIIRKLEQRPRRRIAPESRVTIEQFKHSPQLRRIAPSIDIQSINFAFSSASIPPSERWKVGQIATAINRIIRRSRHEVFLIEGHTDAVGSRASNQRLSEARAATVAGILVHHFGVPPRAIETIGYGEDYLLIPTPYENWRNRRVTLRRMTDFVTPY